ncbi:MAG: maleylpyruvate isomerase family mycothiol-dependent enzyme [Micromonosporaceae bacterium]
MEFPRLLECLEADHARLRDVVAEADLTAKVPTCPEWSLADLVQHVAAVYLHKVECMRLGQQPPEWPPDFSGEEPRALLERGYATLTAEFAARAPESPAYTWFDPDQTVGFWIRRMAQETVIHRIDAELGAGGPVAPVPADLAVDGVDEVLRTFLEFEVRSWPDYFANDLAAAGGGTSVRVEAGSAAWLVRLAPDGVRVSPGEPDRADATVRGEPGDVVRWLWNRAGDDVVERTGDEAALARLGRVLTTATQ